MRLKARHLGYRLNQRGLYKNVSSRLCSGAARELTSLRRQICFDRNGAVVTEGTRVECRTEEDSFDKLGVPWR